MRDQINTPGIRTTRFTQSLAANHMAFMTIADFGPDVHAVPQMHAAPSAEDGTAYLAGHWDICPQTGALTLHWQTH